MITYYCPECWSELTENPQVCPNCGYSLGSYSALAFEEKLLAALHHPVAERRIMAAQILGNLNSIRAIPEFLHLIETEENYFLLRAVLMAVVKIDHPEQEKILRLATQHKSSLVANLAKELLEENSHNQNVGKWDLHTG